MTEKSEKYTDSGMNDNKKSSSIWGWMPFNSKNTKQADVYDNKLSMLQNNKINKLDTKSNLYSNFSVGEYSFNDSSYGNNMHYQLPPV